MAGIGTKNTWGNWGDLVFQGKVTPVLGSYTTGQTYNYTTHSTINSGDLLQAGARALQTITLTLDVTQILMTRKEYSFIEKAVTVAGGGIPGTDLGNEVIDDRLFTDIDELVSEINDYAKEFESLPFFEGGEYRGAFVLTSATEEKEHYPDGMPKRLRTRLQFLEDRERELQ